MKSSFLILFALSLLYSRTSYTGYSGATGSKGFCASSCHGSGTGTITLSGIPQSYVPLKTYTIAVKHNGGSKISNYNISSRIGMTTSAAGTFSSGTNSSTYVVANVETGIRGSVSNIDSSLFQWTAPQSGSGDVKLYLSGLQGSKSGATTKLIVTISENVTGVSDKGNIVRSFSLEQNYPNPFNPVTSIRYSLPQSGMVLLTLSDLIGNTIQTIVNEYQEQGTYAIRIDIDDRNRKNMQHLSSGIYFYTLTMNDHSLTKKMIVLK